MPLVEAGKLTVLSTRLLSLVNRLNLNLGRGESEAIALATELQADFTILDDRAARKIAINLALLIIGMIDFAPQPPTMGEKDNLKSPNFGGFRGHSKIRK